MTESLNPALFVIQKIKELNYGINYTEKYNQDIR